MKILIIRKDAIALIPPLLSVANILSDLGHEVHIITSAVSESIANQLSHKGITYEAINWTGKRNYFGKVYQYLMFRKDVYKVLRNTYFDLLWIEDAHTILSLGKGILKYKYVLQISELYETDNRLLKAINKVIRMSQTNFMPEYNRCVLYQNWFNLPVRPILLPNKPYFIPNRKEISEIKNRYTSVINQLRDKKIIIYQGRIHPERLIDGFVAASKHLGEEWRFVIMGKDGYGLIEHYKSLNEKLIHIDFIPAPDYLAITSMARIGVLSYDPRQLNTAYCAPNKIFEYGAFGIPMVGNDIPGLKILQEKHCGIIVNENNIEEIVNAYRKIDNNFDYFSTATLKNFEETDNVSTIRNSLKEIQF